MIKVIGFDLGGVYLTDCWCKSVREKIAKKFDVPLNTLEKRNKKFVKKLTEGKISEEQFLNKLFHNLNVDIKKVGAYIRKLNRILFSRNAPFDEKVKKELSFSFDE